MSIDFLKCSKLSDIINKKSDHLFLFTNGKFSLIDIIKLYAKKLENSDIWISTFGCGLDDAIQLNRLKENKNVKNIKLVLDEGFPKRSPQHVTDIEVLIGTQNIRYVSNHAKVVLIKSKNECFFIRGSSNLNKNNRIENFDITRFDKSPKFILEFFNDIFRLTPPEQIPVKKANQIRKEIFGDMDFDIDFDIEGF